jgi:2-polyprenyl-6-methoxyphenol hydroxylase-like FAD-dependent oxidoreductase
MSKIGIIGAGIAGLQLGLFLRHAGVEVTIYTEQTADQLLSSRLPNAVIRSAPTRARERLLGVAHWDDEDVALTHLTLRIQGERPLSFSGAYDEPCMSVDMRIYCARLLEDFARRGGHVRVGTLQLEDVAALAGEHDLVVVATGRGALGTLFPRIAEYSPFTSPQRLVVGGFFHGVAPDEPRALDFTYVPGQGEILSFPVVSFEPGLTVIAFESIAGGAFEPVARMRYVDDPGQFEASVLDLLRTYAPSIHARIDRDAFALSRRLDLCHAAITPTVRAGYRRLETGKYVVALGDAHVVNDPIIGQGANTASYAAWALGEAILDAQSFDEAFCRDAEQRIWVFTQPVTEGTNGRLRPPQPHMLEVLRAATQHQAVADAYAWGFNHPEHFWAAMSTPEQASIFLADVTQLEQMEMAPAVASGY